LGRHTRKDGISNVTGVPLELTRAQILAYRRAVNGLEERLPPGATSLRRAAWAGLQDSMPRAALLSLHARVADIGPSSWEDPALVQLWGPRFSAYVVAAGDVAPFSLGRFPDGVAERRRAVQTAARLGTFLDGRRMTYGEVGHALGLNPNALRYAAPTGTVLIRWDGARQSTVWTVPAPEVDPFEARLELARRYLHVFGPGTPKAFAAWAGIKPPGASATFDALGRELTPARTPVGDRWILAQDEPAFRAPEGPPASARFLPSGDAYWLLWGADRALLVPEADRRDLLWTPRVWPGALIVGGEMVGTWRRAEAKLTVQPWRRLTKVERAAVEAEVGTLPLPGLTGPIDIGWEA
jgi:DNA glycosylase AlkZ-like